MLKMTLSRLAGLSISLGTVLYIDTPIGKPYFILTCFAFFFVFLSIFKRNKIDFSATIIISLFVLTFYISKLVLSDSPSDYKYVLNILILPIVYLSMSRLSIREIISILIICLSLSVVIFGVEFIYRIQHPVIGGAVVGAENESSGSFYMYKESSLMYNNSNGVGMHIAFFVVLILSVFKCDRNKNIMQGYQKKIFKIILFIYCLLLFGTLSRAAIFVVFLAFILYASLNNKKLALYIYILISPFILIFLGFEFSKINITDQSFLTKFEILNNLLSYLNDADLSQILFGNVFNHYSTIYSGFIGFVGHTHYFDLIFTSGLIGSFFYIFLLIAFGTESKSYSFLFLLVFFVLGFSNIRLFGHYIFYVMAVILVIVKKTHTLEIKSV